ncbi:MAG: hypothetical protein RL238_163 [Actinomycetota bacterium]|jgi:sortase (surface protein transpeptidase)
MTVAAASARSSWSDTSWWSRRGRSAVPVSRDSAPPLSPRLHLIRLVLVLVCVFSTTLLLQLTIVSSFQHSAAQGRMFDEFRSQLANGVAPIGPADAQDRLLELGAPVAYLEIRVLGIDEVVGEGTTAGVLFDGVGHRRDTPLPGQVGTSVIMGRRAAFGGPFADIASLQEGDRITVTTSQGVFEYSVIGVRYEGQPAPPPPAADESRLMLVTAGGRPYLPDGVVRVDAELDGDAVGGPPRPVTAVGLPANEKIMAADTSTLWALALWLQALIVLCIGLVWAWHRWGRAQAWVVFLPLLLLVGLAVSGEAARLLPNLL